MARQDHVYVNLNRKLVELVDNCVTNIFKNGAQKYVNRKDFLTKAVQSQIELEKQENIKLKKLLVSMEVASST